MKGYLHWRASANDTPRRLTLPFLSALVALCACASQPQTHPWADANLLAFLADTHVTRTEVTARLGDPHAIFENGRIVAYRLGHNNEGYFVVPAAQKQTQLDWQGVDYDLMLAFDDAGILREHSIIALHAGSPQS
jgi:hypothetical protein